MESLWEYTFPVISLGSYVALQKGTDDLVGVAIADYPDMPASIPTIFIAGRKMFSLPPSARTRRTSFFELDLKRKQVIISSMTVPNVSGDPFRLFYDQERTIWLGELGRSLSSYDWLELYEIHPEEDPQWVRRVFIDGKQVDLGNKQCITFWKTDQKVQCLFVVPDVGETEDAQVFWATWSLQTTDVQEQMQQIGSTDAITIHVTKQGCLLFLYQRYLDEAETPFSYRQGSGLWQLSCLAYDNDGHLHHHEIIPQLTTPIRDRNSPDRDLYETFLLQMAVEQGPLSGPEQKPTCVAIATRQEKTSNVSTEELKNVEHKSKREDGLEAPPTTVGRLLWMDQQGHILWAEDGHVGEHVALCCCGEMVVGTDLFEGQWRVWHWLPSARTGIQGETFLPKEVIKVTVLAKEPHLGEKDHYFWCLEQHARGLRVVQRESAMGTEVQDIWCEGFTLFYEYPGIGFQTERCQGVTLSEGRLVLLGRDEDEKIKIIYIQS